MSTSETKIIRTMCPMSCHPTFCGMLAEVEDGKLVGTKGDKDNPDSQGFLCVRGQNAHQVIGNPKRLLRPRIRKQRGLDEWRDASWDEALDLVADNIKAATAERTGIWLGHGTFTLGGATSNQLAGRFASLLGCHNWSPSMICWGLGGFGVGLTGTLATSTKEDMSAHSELVVLWGANFASQPNTARHVVQARKRGARIVTIDIRRSEAAAQSDEVYVIRPGTDAALALGMMNVIIDEGLYDEAFVSDHTVGFDALRKHVAQYTPDWAAGITGIAADRISALARTYATTNPAMILLGGSSMHKGDNTWSAARAVSCLPGLTGNLGVSGGGMGPRHGAMAPAAGNIAAVDNPKRPARPIPQQMPEIAAALGRGDLDVMLLMGTNMLSSFSDTNAVADGLAKTKLVICFDLFMSDTARRAADVVLPGTAWLEETGYKATNSHFYLMERALDPEGETKPLYWVFSQLADRLGLVDFFPWASQEELLDAMLDNPFTGHTTIAALRASGGIAELNVPHVAFADRKFQSPSGKVEFYSERAKEAGLPPLPTYEGPAAPQNGKLTLTQGRTLTQFHSFYDHGQALPGLAKHNKALEVWISPEDAQARDISDRAPIQLSNERGRLEAVAHVTDNVPAGVIWTRDGWEGFNAITSGEPVVPETALGIFPFSVGQSHFGAEVDVAPL